MFERRQDFRQQTGGERRHGCQTHPPGAQRKLAADITECGIPVGQQTLGGGQEGFPLGGQRQGTCRTHQQLATQCIFQPLDGNAQGRLRQKQLIRCFGKTAAAGDRNKRANLLDGDVQHGVSIDK